MLLPGHRHQQHASAVLPRLGLGMENGAQLVQDLLQTTQPHRDAGEVADVRVPELAQAARGGSEKIQVEGLHGGAALVHVLDEGSCDIGVAGKHEAGQLGDGGRLGAGPRPSMRAPLPGSPARQHKPGDDLGLDRQRTRRSRCGTC